MTGVQTCALPIWREEKKLFLRGTVSSVFHDFIQRDIPGVQAIWRNEVRPARITEVSSSNEGSTLYYSPSPSIDREGEIRYAVNLDDVMEDIAKMSRASSRERTFTFPDRAARRALPAEQQDPPSS